MTERHVTKDASLKIGAPEVIPPVPPEMTVMSRYALGIERRRLTESDLSLKQGKVTGHPVRVQGLMGG